VILRRGCFFQRNFLCMSLLPDVVGELCSQQVVGASCVAWILYYHIFRARGVKRSHHARSHFFPPKL